MPIGDKATKLDEAYAAFRACDDKRRKEELACETLDMASAAFKAGEITRGVFRSVIWDVWFELN